MQGLTLKVLGKFLQIEQSASETLKYLDSYNQYSLNIYEQNHALRFELIRVKSKKVQKRAKLCVSFTSIRSKVNSIKCP